MLLALLQQGSAIEAVDALHVADRGKHAHTIPFHQPFLRNQGTVMHAHIPPKPTLTL